MGLGRLRTPPGLSGPFEDTRPLTRQRDPHPLLDTLRFSLIFDGGLGEVYAMGSDEELQSLSDSIFTDQELRRLVAQITADEEKDREALAALIPTDAEFRRLVEEYTKPEEAGRC
jgi:hypothetical protein